MNLKKYKVLVVGGGILLVLIAVASFMLIKFRGEYVETRKKLKRVAEEVRKLNTEPVHPSEENGKLLARKQAELESFLKEFRVRLSEGQIEPSPETRDTYLDYMRGILNSIYTEHPKVQILSEETKQTAGGAEIIGPDGFPVTSTNTVTDVENWHRVKIAEGFDFDFPSYYDGLLPETNHIQRLTIQLQTIKRVCELLYEADIEELVRVDRDEFDVESSAQKRDDADKRDMERAMLQGVKKSSKDHLFSREELEVEFRADEAAVWKAINLIAQDDAALEITSVNIQNEHPTIQPKSEAKKSSGARNRPPPRRRPSRPSRGSSTEAPSETVDINELERKPGAGNEKITVILKLSAYRFNATGEVAAAPAEESL